MTSNQRLILAVVVLAVDLFVVVIPVSAILIAYVVLARPVWFRDWVTRLYDAA